MVQPIREEKMKPVGKKTPVWRNRETGTIVCGDTVQDALGFGWLYPVGNEWERVYSVEKECRVVIEGGRVLPVNETTVAIARNANKKGKIELVEYGRQMIFDVIYCDDTKVIIK